MTDKINRYFNGRLTSLKVKIYRNIPAWQCRCNRCGKIVYVKMQRMEMLKTCKCKKERQ